MATVLMILIAVFMDYLLGEPRRWHPLAGFGQLVTRVEASILGSQTLSPAQSRLRGMVAVLVLLVPLVLVGVILSSLPGVGYVFSVLCLYVALGARSLQEHAHAVMQALHVSDIPQAQFQVGMMVSRDTSQLDDEGVSKAAIESVLENGCDAIFGALFWFVVLGAPGVIAYRVINTLDAMWGYRNTRYYDFGWAAARLDDVMNWIPARLTALSYALVGHTRQALFCWQQQAMNWESPNAGPVMASGAGALSCCLGGVAIYHGKLKERPLLGSGRAPNATDIKRAVSLVQKAQILWLAVIFIGGLLLV
ncbi:MAG: adenosylcobinamide-phosphate synthase CbiB [Gammaproteobacteria bacterium]|nr:adenosylcobinamide-phosphate synthase CbiB [Gammaproteobacteria bacterium]